MIEKFWIELNMLKSCIKRVFEEKSNFAIRDENEIFLINKPKLIHFEFMKDSYYKHITKPEFDYYLNSAFNKEYLNKIDEEYLEEYDILKTNPLLYLHVFVTSFASLNDVENIYEFENLFKSTSIELYKYYFEDEYIKDILDLAPKDLIYINIEIKLPAIVLLDNPSSKGTMYLFENEKFLSYEYSFNVVQLFWEGGEEMNLLEDLKEVINDTKEKTIRIFNSFDYITFNEKVVDEFYSLNLGYVQSFFRSSAKSYVKDLFEKESVLEVSIEPPGLIEFFHLHEKNNYIEYIDENLKILEEQARKGEKIDFIIVGFYLMQQIDKKLADKIIKDHEVYYESYNFNNKSSKTYKLNSIEDFIKYAREDYKDVLMTFSINFWQKVDIEINYLF